MMEISIILSMGCSVNSVTIDLESFVQSKVLNLSQKLQTLKITKARLYSI